MCVFHSSTFYVPCCSKYIQFSLNEFIVNSVSVLINERNKKVKLMILFNMVCKPGIFVPHALPALFRRKINIKLAKCVPKLYLHDSCIIPKSYHIFLGSSGCVESFFFFFYFAPEYTVKSNLLNTPHYKLSFYAQATELDFPPSILPYKASG